jgi:hypothetical protein
MVLPTMQHRPSSATTDFTLHCRCRADTAIAVLSCCRQADGCGVRRDMTLSEYLAWWRQRPVDKGRSHSGASTLQPPLDRAVAANDSIVSPSARGSSGAPELTGVTRDGGHDGDLQQAPLLYLKDWHFASEHPHYQVNDPAACTPVSNAKHLC